MKSMIVALLASAAMSTAFGQTTPQQPVPAPAAQTPAKATVPGAQGATVQSLGDMTTFAVVGGVAVVGVIAAVASSGGSSNKNTPGTTGTTGTTQ